MKIKINSFIFALVFFTVFLISASLIYTAYYFSKDIALEATVKHFRSISKSLASKVSDDNHSFKNFYTFLKQSLGDDIVINKKNQKKIFSFFYKYISINNSIDSIHLVDRYGNIYALVHMKDYLGYKKEYKSNKQTKWIEFVLRNKVLIVNFYDKNLKLLHKKSKKDSYDIKKEVWYDEVVNSDKMFVTHRLQLEYIDDMFLVFAKHIGSHTIISLDYSIKSIEKILKEKKLDLALDISLFDSDGKFLGGTNPNHTTVILFDKNNTDKIVKVKKEKEKYYTYITKIPGIDFYLGFEINSKILLEPFIKNIKYLIAVSFAIFILFLPLAFFVSKTITKQIHKLIEQNQKIKKREFDKVKRVDTAIVELFELSFSLEDMAKNLLKYEKEQEALLDAIVKLIADAIDNKSKYTGGHCKRVPKIAQMILERLNKDEEKFKSFRFDEESEKRAFEIGAWLHDCGKITTPEYVVDKATKLETIYNRIHEIRTRFEVLLRDLMIKELKAEITKEEFEKEKEKLFDDFEFIAKVNIGSEFLSDEDIKRVKDIANRVWLRYFDDTLGLSYEE